MKPFDLERAKAGDPVIQRNGLPAKILDFDLKDTLGYNIAAKFTLENGYDRLGTIMMANLQTATAFTTYSWHQKSHNVGQMCTKIVLGKYLLVIYGLMKKQLETI